jgi:glycosyltransferase involved in cell wall biosynthesis
VPNGYEAPDASAGKDGVGSPPTILFQGLLTYPPNADGARWLVEEVASALRARVPGLRIRLVGRAGEDVRRLQDPPRVVVTGPVPEMSSELALVDLVAVPIRIGSGTRIKILEAFAHRIPVVSTTTGAEGLDAVDGRHLLIADTRETFTAACLELLTDPVRRATLIDEAHRLFMERYQWEDIRKRVVALAAGVVQGGTDAAEVPLPIGEHGRFV